MNRSEEAIAVYDALLERFKDSDELALQERVAKALVNKGATLGQLNRSEEAIAVYDALLEQFKDSDELALQEQVAKAQVNKGATLGQLNRSEEAIAVYDALLERFKDNEEAVIQRQVVTALCNKAELVIAGNSKEQAINAIRDAIFFIKDGNKQDRAAMELLSFIIEETTVSSVFRKIEDIPESENFEWRFNEARHVIESLDSPRKEQVEAFARYFEDHHNKVKLKEELDQIPNI